MAGNSCRTESTDTQLRVSQMSGAACQVQELPEGNHWRQAQGQAPIQVCVIAEQMWGVKNVQQNWKTSL